MNKYKISLLTTILTTIITGCSNNFTPKNEFSSSDTTQTNEAISETEQTDKNLRYTHFGVIDGSYELDKHFYVIGQITPKDYMPITGSATYEGKITGEGVAGSTFKLTADFANHEIKGGFDINNFITSEFTGIITENKFESTDDSMSKANGQFNGPYAEEVSGKIEKIFWGNIPGYE